MLYIFDLDSTLVKLYDTEPLPGVHSGLDVLKREGHALAIATNQAGPAWRMETGDEKFPEATSLGRRFREIAGLIPLLEKVPWFVSLYDDRLSLDQRSYDTLVRDFEFSGGRLELHISADPSWRKPRPGMLLAACRRYGLSIAQAVFVGDAETDAEAALAAGMGFIFEDEFFDHRTAI
ncbi:MAG: HAD-IA family hydrolase [Anaerolineae bacterium]